MIYWAIFAAGVLHVVEEYFFPGGFTRVMKEFQPRFAPFITVPFAVIINGLFLVLCLLAALRHGRPPLLGLTVAALVGLNGLGHTAAAVKLKGYAPGVVSGLALYVPLAIIAFAHELSRKSITVQSAILAAVFGLLAMAVPIAYLGLAGLLSIKR